MKLHRISAVVIRHVYEGRHNIDRITDTLLWPVMDIVVWGFFSIYLARDNRLQPGLVSFLLSAVILWGMFRSFQRDMAVGFLAELWSRNLINLFSTPLSVPEYMTGLIAVNLIKVLLGTASAGLIAWVCYSFDIFPVFLELIPFMLNLVIFALAVGVVITGLIFRYTTRIQGLTWSLTALLMPLSCVFYPVRSLPEGLRPFALGLPTSHAFEGMRQAISGRGFSVGHFGWGAALNAVYMILAFVFFRFMFESARSRGLLVKIE